MTKTLISWYLDNDVIKNDSFQDLDNVRAMGPAAYSSHIITTSASQTQLNTGALTTDPGSLNTTNQSTVTSTITNTSSNTNNSQSQVIANSSENSMNVDVNSSNKQIKPALPPKPTVASKPQPPPRQKGDPLASSTESLNTAGQTIPSSNASNNR